MSQREDKTYSRAYLCIEIDPSDMSIHNALETETMYVESLTPLIKRFSSKLKIEDVFVIRESVTSKPKLHKWSNK